MGKREAKPVAEQTPFTPVPETPPAAAALDPRAVGGPASETKAGPS